MIRGVAERGDSLEDGPSPLSSDAAQAGKGVRYRRRRHAGSDSDIVDRRSASRGFRRFAVLHSANYLLSNSEAGAFKSTRPKRFTPHSQKPAESQCESIGLFEPRSGDNHKTVLPLRATFATLAAALLA